MGVPKRRVSSRRKRERRTHHALTVPNLDECSHCHQPKRPHHACPNCGWYGGRAAIKIREKSTPEQNA